MAAAARRPDVIATDPSSSFVCDYVAGINRALALPPYLLVDNIGRNVEIWRFQPGNPEPVARARYDLTSYPGDPSASLLDVDIHAAFLRGGGSELLAVNHYGRLRAFDLPAAAACLRPAWERQLLGDTERIVMAGDCCIASSPRGEFTEDPPQPGIFLFEPITAPPPSASDGTARLGCEQAYQQALPGWGVVSALAVSAEADRLAVAAGERLGVFVLECSSTGLRLGDCLWEAPLSYCCQWLHIDEHRRLWAAGHRPPPPADASDEWSVRRGGGIDAFTVDSGAHRFAATLPEETSWGYGADPVVPGTGCRQIYVLGRDASLHVIDAASGASRRLYESSPPDDAATPSLGIGHATLLDGRIYAGFSRGGFRLWRYDV